jgi:hypothetical protein
MEIEILNIGLNLAEKFYVNVKKRVRENWIKGWVCNEEETQIQLIMKGFSLYPHLL